MTVDKKSNGGEPAMYLVPWDPDSQEHRERMRLQRVACGWNVDQIDAWIDAQRAGHMGFHWVVLHPAHPKTPSRLESHFAAYPDEIQGLRDSSKMILGRPHTPDPLIPVFHPVGHVSLATLPVKKELETSLSKGILSLLSFYVSGALRNIGMGGATLKYCERMAKEKFGAKTMTLETIANEYCRADSPRQIALKRPAPAVSNQDWYEHYGYEIYCRKECAWVDIDDTGKEWETGSVFLRKDLV